MKGFRDKRASVALRSGLKSSHTSRYATVSEPLQVLRTVPNDKNNISELQGLKFLVTAGPTIEAIDPVRFISNHSTGKMGYAVAAELAARGAEVILVSGRTALPVPAGVLRIDVVSAEDMYRECVALWPGMDGAVMCAAVADYTPVEVSAVKMKKIGKESDSELRVADREVGKACVGFDPNVEAVDGEISIRLRPTKDIAAELGRTKRPGQMLVGFALETDHEEANAIGKLERKNLDLIVLNSLRDAGAGFGCDTNRITIFSRTELAGSATGSLAGAGNMTGRAMGSEDGSIRASGSKTDPGADEFLPSVYKTTYPLESKQAAAGHIVDGIERLYERL